MLIRPLPYADADWLVKLWEDAPGSSRMEPSAANLRDWRARATSFAGMGANGIGEPRRAIHAALNADVMTMLGTHPVLGRVFLAE